MGADDLLLILLKHTDQLKDIRLIDTVIPCKIQSLLIRVIIHKLGIRTQRSRYLAFLTNKESIISAISVGLHQSMLRKISGTLL